MRRGAPEPRLGYQPVSVLEPRAMNASSYSALECPAFDAVVAERDEKPAVVPPVTVAAGPSPFKAAVAAKRAARASGDHGIYCAYKNVAPSAAMVAEPARFLSYDVNLERLYVWPGSARGRPVPTDLCLRRMGQVVGVAAEVRAFAFRRGVKTVFGGV